MRFDTLSSRIFAALATILVLLVVAAAVFGEVRIRAFHRTEVDARLRTAAGLLKDSAADALVTRADRQAFAARLVEMGRATRLRLTVITPEGVVIADSASPLPLAPHGDRAEILRAASAGEGLDSRRSATTGKETRYLAQRIDEGGRPIGYLRAAAELEEMEVAIRHLRKTLLLGGLVALGVGLAFSALLARWLAQPLEEMGQSAMAVTSGELDARIRSTGPVEVRLLVGALNSMADQLRQQIRGERRARAEIETILASMSEGVVAVDSRERVLLMNETAARMLGLSGPLPTGVPLWQKLRFPDLERALGTALAGGEPSHGDAVTPAGNGRTLSLSVAPVRGETPAAVALLSDVTEVRKLERVRIDFVANVSHELRTPLSAILGALETLAGVGEDEATRRRFLDIAQRNAGRLQAIVGDLLDLSSIETQDGEIPLEPIPVDEPVRAAAAALSGAAQRKGIELTVAADKGTQVLGNRRRLEQAFTNLIANAIQYTPAGGSIRARVRPARREVRIDVEDTGIGIPADAIPRVFERFYRVDRGRSRETGGTGLGLAIVKHIVLAHGGKVDVRSEEGRGSTFTVQLPRELEPCPSSTKT